MREFTRVRLASLSAGTSTHVALSGSASLPIGRVTVTTVSVPTEVGDAVVAAIHSGDLAELRQLLSDHPGVGSAPLGGRHKTRTALHVVTDWPGYFPNGPEVVRMLVEAGADPDARQPGDETPLHWAASSDDAHVAAALIDCRRRHQRARRVNRHPALQRRRLRLLGGCPAPRRPRRSGR